ncbi:hypothetical protein B0H11DRAFT_1915481 [Mycena galericulata]|nr:hypothetical protein B0H11DRAFT_1915481 [Mycena galericulata]
MSDSKKHLRLCVGVSGASEGKLPYMERRRSGWEAEKNWCKPIFGKSVAKIQDFTDALPQQSLKRRPPARRKASRGRTTTTPSSCPYNSPAAVQYEVTTLHLTPAGCSDTSSSAETANRAPATHVAFFQNFLAAGRHVAGGVKKAVYRHRGLSCVLQPCGGAAQRRRSSSRDVPTSRDVHETPLPFFSRFLAAGRHTAPSSGLNRQNLLVDIVVATLSLRRREAAPIAPRWRIAFQRAGELASLHGPLLVDLIVKPTSQRRCDHHGANSPETTYRFPVSGPNHVRSQIPAAACYLPVKTHTVALFSPSYIQYLRILAPTTQLRPVNAPRRRIDFPRTASRAASGYISFQAWNPKFDFWTSRDRTLSHFIVVLVYLRLSNLDSGSISPRKQPPRVPEPPKNPPAERTPNAVALPRHKVHWFPTRQNFTIYKGELDRASGLAESNDPISL